MIKKIEEKISGLVSDIFDNNKIALMITAYNRPSYFEQVVDSINKCDELENVPIFIFLDGGIKSTKTKNIEIAKKIIWKNKFVISRDKNYGCERNILLGFKMLFNDLNFDYLCVIEDDLIVSKNYFKFIYEQYKIIKLEDPKIGMYQGWIKCTMNKEQKIFNLNKNIHSVDDHLWGFIFEKATFKNLEENFNTYLKIFDDLPYDYTYKFLRDQKTDEFLKLEENISKDFMHLDNILIQRIKNKKISVSQDAFMDLLLFIKGYKRYFSAVNRSICIGEIGLHQTPELWRDTGIGNVILHEEILKNA